MTRKRQRERKNNALKDEYKCFSFDPIESSGRPGSPHRFFESSFNCTFVATTSCDDEKKTKKDNVTESGGDGKKGSTTILTHDKQPIQCETPEREPLNLIKDPNGTNEVDHYKDSDHLQVVHRHANGLCIVTAGTLVKKILGVEKDNSLSTVEFKVSAPDPTSLGGKRKKRAKIMSNSNNKNEQPGLIKPSDTIATLTFKNGKQLDLKSCVYGTILEINTKLAKPSSENDKNKSSKRVDDSTMNQDSSSLLVSDPLLDGYLAVILPNGPFPFRN